MYKRISAFFVAAMLATGAMAQEPPDIVGEAADAIIAQDAEALEGMQFEARDFASKLIPIADFLEQIKGCEIVANYKRWLISRVHEIHYDCKDGRRPKRECWSNLTVVAIDRASSPHVTAYLRDKRFDAPQCQVQRPAVPSPG